MADNNLLIFRMNFGQTGADKTVGGTVEAIAANLVLFIIFIRQRINVCFRRHGAVEGVVKNNNLRYAFAEHSLGCPNALQVSRIVERG